MVSTCFILPGRRADVRPRSTRVALREKTRRAVWYITRQNTPLYRDASKPSVRVNLLDRTGRQRSGGRARGADVVRLPKTDTAQDVIDIENEILRIEKRARGREPGSTTC